MASIDPKNLDVTGDLAADDRIMTTNKDGITKTIFGSTLLEFNVTASAADAPAAAENKIITLSDFAGNALPTQFKLNAVFTEGNTFGDTTAASPTYPKIIIKNKDNVALGTFNLCDSRGHFAGTGCYNNGDLMCLKRIGNKLLITNSDVRQANTSSTSGYTIYADGRIRQWHYNGNTINYGNSYTWNFPIPFNNLPIVTQQVGGAFSELNIAYMNIRACSSTSINLKNCCGVSISWIWLTAEGYLS